MSSIQNDSSLDYLQKIKAELALRQKILGKVLDCAVQEAEVLKTRLEETNVKDAEVTAAKLKLNIEIDQVILLYKNRAKTVKDLGIYGSKSLAGQLSEWRLFNYNDLVSRVANIISWNNSQGAIDLVEKRLDNIKKAFIDLKVVDPSLEKIMQTAEDNLKKAEDMNELARRAIVNSYQVDQQLVMIRDSLEAIAGVYKNFFEVSDILTASSTTK
ncbi:MAG: hypothetical protein AAB738_00540 [Patescibacteria group bacterium]